MLSVWGWAASAWHLILWLQLYFHKARLTAKEVKDKPRASDAQACVPGGVSCASAASAATASTSGRLGSEATDASGLDSAADESTLSPCSVESDSWDDSTALSWDMEAEEDEALDPARLGASPSDALVRGHLDFACRDGAMDTPAAVFNESQGSAVVPFRNATGEPLSLAVELWVEGRAAAAAWARLRWWQLLPSLPTLRLEPASGQLGPGEEGRLTLRLNDFALGEGVEQLGCVELRSRAGEEERLVEIPLVMALLPKPIVTQPNEPFMLPHSRHPRFNFIVSSEDQALWIRLPASRGTWYLLRPDGILNCWWSFPSNPASGHWSRVWLGEAVEASQGDVEELDGLEGEELGSRTQALANLAFHSRSPEAPSVRLIYALRMSRLAALGTEPETCGYLARAPSSTAVRLRNRSRLHSLAWAAEAPRGLVCEPPAGCLGPSGEAELHLRAEAPPQELRLIIRSGYVPPEERAAVDEAPGDFVRRERRLFPDHLHLTIITFYPSNPCSIS